MRNCTIRVAKTKALISFAVTAKLICAFVFAYADCWFSHEAAHLFCGYINNFSVMSGGNKLLSGYLLTTLLTSNITIKLKLIYTCWHKQLCTNETYASYGTYTVR